MFNRNRMKRLFLLLKQDSNASSKTKATEKIDMLLALLSKWYKKLGIKPTKKELEKYTEKILIADLADRITVEGILGAKIYFALFCCIFFLLSYLGNPSPTILLVSIIGGIIAYKYPDAFIDIRIKKRQYNIQMELPVLLNTMAVITDAGLSLMEAIKKITETRKGTLVNELKKVIDEVNIGMSQKEAFLRLAERCKINEVTVFVFTLNQNMEKGTSGITKILKAQAKEAWEKRKSKARELGEKASMKLFMPMMLLVFPSVLIFMLGPAVVSLMKSLSK